LAYYYAHRDKISEEKREERRQYVKQWRTANPEKMRAYNLKAREWNRTHREKMREIDVAWRTANPEKRRASYERWRVANPEKMAAKEGRRRSRKMLTAEVLTKEELTAITEIYRQCRLMTKLSGIQYHVDHKIALSNGGKHHPENLQLLPAMENLKKGAR